MYSCSFKDIIVHDAITLYRLANFQNVARLPHSEFKRLCNNSCNYKDWYNFALKVFRIASAYHFREVFKLGELSFSVNKYTTTANITGSYDVVRFKKLLDVIKTQDEHLYNTLLKRYAFIDDIEDHIIFNPCLDSHLKSGRHSATNIKTHTTNPVILYAGTDWIRGCDYLYRTNKIFIILSPTDKRDYCNNHTSVTSTFTMNYLRFLNILKYHAVIYPSCLEIYKKTMAESEVNLKNDVEQKTLQEISNRFQTIAEQNRQNESVQPPQEIEEIVEDVELVNVRSSPSNETREAEYSAVIHDELETCFQNELNRALRKLGLVSELVSETESLSE